MGSTEDPENHSFFWKKLICQVDFLPVFSSGVGLKPPFPHFAEKEQGLSQPPPRAYLHVRRLRPGALTPGWTSGAGACGSPPGRRRARAGHSPSGSVRCFAERNSTAVWLAEAQPAAGDRSKASSTSGNNPPHLRMRSHVQSGALTVKTGHMRSLLESTVIYRQDLLNLRFS